MQISDEDRKIAAETIGFAVERIRSVLGEGGRDALVYSIAEALSAARAEVWDAAITIASGNSKSGALMPSEIVEALEAAKADEQNQEGEIR